MAYAIDRQGNNVALELSGGVTARDAAELAKSLAQSVNSGASVVVQTRELDDVDTCILQMLIALQRSVEGFIVEDPSEVFVNAIERCALRRELLAGSKEAL